jgi:uncharacterized protein (DUF1330 family)
MPAYLISLCRDVTDRTRLEEYWANVAPAFKNVLAKPLVAYTPFEVLEGDRGGNPGNPGQTEVTLKQTRPSGMSSSAL